MTRARLPPAMVAAAGRSNTGLAQLVQSGVGLMDEVRFASLGMGDPDVDVASATLGHLSMTLPYLPDGPSPTGRGGAGSDIDPCLAWVRAAAEAAERYATIVFDGRDFIIASPGELGDGALDLRDIPRCSPAEYSDARCPLLPPRLDLPLRWVRGFSLASGKERLVPAVMTHLHIVPWASERFWLQISTGVAAHTDLHTALCASICETVERDAIALTWLGRIPLPSISLDVVDSLPLRSLLQNFAHASVRHRNFDATTDIGVPTVFSIQESEGHPYCHLSVSAATDFDPVAAQLKVLREACAGRLLMNRHYDIPEDIMDFRAMTDGAHYYGRGGHDADFAFLLGRDRAIEESVSTTSLGQMAQEAAGPRGGTQLEQLKFLVAKLRELGHDAIAVDLTTDELKDVGLWVVRVIIPGLMPISFVQRARYLGTPRLYEYVSKVRNRPFREADVNPAPLPFA